MSNTHGRPSSMTVSVVSKLEEALRAGKTIKMACYLSGISRETYYKHMRADEGFSDKMGAAQSWIENTARSRIAKAIIEGDLNSSKWWLEKRVGSEFSNSHERLHPARGTEPLSPEPPEEYIENHEDKLSELMPIKESLDTLINFHKKSLHYQNTRSERKDD